MILPFGIPYEAVIQAAGGRPSADDLPRGIRFPGKRGHFEFDAKVYKIRQL